MLWARYRVAVLLDGEIVACLYPGTIQVRVGELETEGTTERCPRKAMMVFRPMVSWWCIHCCMSAWVTMST